MEGQTKFTRRNLYELVWSLPQKEAAEILGINRWGLPYFCEKHNVPRPESGYWTKRSLGRTVSKPDLPPGDDDDAIIREVRPKESEPLRGPGPRGWSCPPSVGRPGRLPFGLYRWRRIFCLSARHVYAHLDDKGLRTVTDGVASRIGKAAG